MVESYLDIDIKNINKFEYSQTKANIKNGNKYKSTVRNNEVSKTFSVFSKFSKEIYDYLNDLSKSKAIAEQILKMPQTSNLQEEIFDIFSSEIDEHSANTLSRRYAVVINNLTKGKCSYFEYTRKIIISNIRKAYKLQNGMFDIKPEQIKDVFFDELNLYEILLSQNLASKDKLTGFIWILNTSIFIAANYTAFWNEIN